MGLKEKLEKLMMAVTFAESGEHDTAREMMKDEKRERKVKRPAVRTRPRKELRAPSVRRK